LFLLPAPAGAQSLGSSTTPKQGKRPTAITMAGCVSAKPTSGNFTFTAKDGTQYRLTGKNLKKYAGQEVEIVGGDNKKLAVKGGLLPSPNIAAQAGANNPGQDVIASLPGGSATGAGGVELPEFNVARVRGLGGSCQ
jgi:hypothetical protein